MLTAAAVLLVASAAPAAPVEPAPRLLGLAVGNGSAPFAGDRRLLTTVSPNGDGFRDRAMVTFRLDRPARVRLDVVQTDSLRRAAIRPEIVWTTTRRLLPGRHRLVWRPRSTAAERTYVLRLMVTGGRGARRLYGLPRPGPRPRVEAPVVRVLGISASFPRPSYVPGENANLSIATDARSLRFQVFSLARIPHPTEADLRSGGEAMTPAVTLDWRGHGDAPSRIRVRTGDWSSGLYLLRVTAGDGRVGYAPLLLRPRRLGTHRVAVVLSTNTWQAHNFADANGDGWGDSWSVSGAIRAIDLRRPYLGFGVSKRYRDWDLTIASWLNTTGRSVDYLSDDDLAGFADGAALARRYDLVAFPGQAEYVTAHVYDLVRRYRELGGNLMFLSADNFSWKVVRRGPYLTRVAQWRRLGRPEAALVGVQFEAGKHGGRKAPYRVTGAAADPWVFAGTGLVNGARFGTYGGKIDRRAPSTPRGTRVLARIPNLMGPRRSAEMTYYELRGAKVFAAGVLDFAASADQPVVSRLLANVWDRLSRP